MVYIMEFKVDGACRGNGQPGSTAVAAACLFTRNGFHKTKVKHLPPNNPVPTNQRAEIMAIIMALKWALARYSELSAEPYMDVRIKSDSKYAITSLTTYIHKWIDNGWYNASGRPVANTDLFRLAFALENKISYIGKVTYTWIPREENLDADIECKEALDRT
ncbi:hypothetical protein TWF481_010259 [Arthrobotrys musiformis]|uniref:ribonuclease H n=1 Tax=Arthrobotrys musiformis TaxID=47236 RepID=A0AAV9W274_9PEZI